MDILKDVKGVFSKIAHFFESSKVQSVETQIANMLPVALQYAQELDAAIGKNPMLEGLITFAQKYAVPLATAELTSQTALQNAAMNIVAQVVQKNLPISQANATLAIVNAAVNNAVALAHA